MNLSDSATEAQISVRNRTKPPRLSFASLRARLLLVVILALIPAAAFLILDIALLQQQLQRDATNELLRLSELVASSYSQRVDEAERLLTAIGQFPEVQEGDAEECSAQLARMVELLRPHYPGFSVSNLNGELFCSAIPISDTVHIADRLWFREAVRTGRFAIGDFTLGRPGGTPILGLGYPLLDENDNVTRVLSHGLRLEQLQREAEELPLPDDTVLTVTDRDGIILVRVPDGERWMGQRRTDIEMQQIQQQGEGILEATGADGVKRIYAFTLIRGPGGSDVWLSLGRTPEAMYAGLRAAIIRNILGIGGILLITLAAIWIGSDRLIIQPVRRLAGVSNQLAAGDLDTRTGIKADNSELGDLALAFDHMADALQQRITEQQQTQAELQERERHLHLAIQTARLVAWTWDPHHNTVATTDNVADIFGVSAVEYTNQGFALVHPDDVAGHRQTVMQAVAEQIAYHSEFRIVRPDNGEIVWIDEHAVPIRNETEPYPKFAGVAMDITRRKESERLLQESNLNLEQRVEERTAELERSNRELEQFAYIASHDLKSPLRGIETLVNFVEEDSVAMLPEQSQKHLVLIRRRIRRMEALLNDLLAYSRAGRLRYATEWVNVASLLRETIDLLAPPAGISIEIIEPMPAIAGERIPLETVFRNLILNAVKHHHHPEAAHIRISAVDQGERIEFAVADDGPGIDPSAHVRIFEIFQVLQPRDRVEGSGVGLTMVKKIVETRGGRIWVESQLGKGATFRFTWPKQQPQTQ